MVGKGSRRSDTKQEPLVSHGRDCTSADRRQGLKAKWTDTSLFAATTKEVEKGFIEGPVDSKSLPAGSTLKKRFPVKQKNKVRPIDDYKASLVNFAVTQTEGVTKGPSLFAVNRG